MWNHRARLAWVGLVVLLSLPLQGCNSLLGRDPSPGPGWEYLGEREVPDTDRRGTLGFDPPVGPYTHLMLRSREHAVRILDLQVKLEGGETWAPIKPSVLWARSLSREISIPGAPRRIAAVRFRWRTVGTDLRSRVRFYGKLPEPAQE